MVQISIFSNINQHWQESFSFYTRDNIDWTRFFPHFVLELKSFKRILAFDYRRMPMMSLTSFFISLFYYENN